MARNISLFKYIEENVRVWGKDKSHAYQIIKDKCEREGLYVPSINQIKPCRNESNGINI